MSSREDFYRNNDTRKQTRSRGRRAAYTPPDDRRRGGEWIGGIAAAVGILGILFIMGSKDPQPPRNIKTPANDSNKLTLKEKRSKSNGKRPQLVANHSSSKSTKQEGNSTKNPATRRLKGVEKSVRPAEAATDLSPLNIAHATEHEEVKLIPCLPAIKKRVILFPCRLSNAGDYIRGAKGQWSQAKEVWAVVVDKIEDNNGRWDVHFNCTQELKGEKKEYVQTLTLSSSNLTKDFGLNSDNGKGKAFVVFLDENSYYFLLTLKEYENITARNKS